VIVPADMGHSAMGCGLFLGSLLLCALAWATPAQALNLGEWKRDGLCRGIMLDGDIARDEAASFIKRLIAAVERCGERTIVVLNMPGGSVNDAIAIGEAIRSRDYVTVALPNSICASACGLIYLGGVQRYWAVGARFIIHRPEIRGATSFKTVAESDHAYDALKSRLVDYVAAMGGNPDYVDLMYAVNQQGPGPDYRVLDRADMMRLGLATQDGMP
jgi:hypothetical protein